MLTRSQIRVETITPAKALSILDGSKKLGNGSDFKRNRRLKRNSVARLVSEIEEGKWKEHVGTISLNDDGQCIDGQHRLAAIVEAGRPVRSIVVRNVPADAMDTMDTGTKRGGADVLYMAEITNDVRLAGALNKLKMLMSGFYRGASRPHGDAYRNIGLSNSEYLEFLKVHPGLEESTQIWCGYQPLIMRPTLGAALHYLFSMHDRKMADDFWELVRTGDGIGKGHPAYALRRNLLNFKLDSRRTRVEDRVLVAMSFKAWNAYVEGNDSMMVLRFSTNETFPKLLYPDCIPEPKPSA